MTTSNRQGRRPNRLVKETSPYLLQHAYNPVDWYPWGEEALAKARREDKPILLSVGYAACHWCHVMERESFENEEIARLMNEHFVNIKVDREERPDVDALYMNFVQLSTGSGGWPLTVFLTPDQVPFYGGTYFPPRDHYGRPGFKRILERIVELYRSRREDLKRSAEEIRSKLQDSFRFQGPESPLSPQLLDEAAIQLARSFDRRYGGFGGAPKFPSAMALGFLLRYQERSGSGEALEMVELTLREMARGGIYDQLGGGFHRYAVDDHWLVPHFEKMLYDNALLTRVYLEAYQLTGRPFYRRIVEETVDFVLRELTHPEGGFYSSLDADSEGEEGRFYVWTPEEVAAVLGEEAARVFCLYYDVTSGGNFEGKNILHPRMELSGLARQLNRTEETLQAQLDEWRSLLLRKRSERVRPGLDDKVLAAWNGLMLATLAEAAFVLGRKDWMEAARRNAQFLAEAMLREGRLRRSWKEGQATLPGYLEDYGQVVEGWLALYQVSGELQWLTLARELTELQLELFWDEEEGDFYFTARDADNLLVRQKDYTDNATPSGNAVSCFNLLRLSLLCGEVSFRDKAERMLRRLSGALGRHPLAFGYWLQALDFYLGPVQEVVVVGSEPERSRLLQPLRERFLPRKVLCLSPRVGPREEELVPLLKGKQAPEEGAEAYLCKDFVCGPPVRSPQALLTALSSENL